MNDIAFTRTNRRGIQVRFTHKMARLAQNLRATHEAKKKLYVGAKHDDGKPRAGVMILDFPRALEAVAGVSTFGCQKYEPHSYATVPDANARYYDAFHRHILADARGELNDPESGLRHLAHVAWNALAILELRLREAEGNQ